ncbi:MAG: hypothetical protein EXR07_19265 [Acetobacteraceae bacterium]|nr:hypothetical protein [Acetobacteraceae bacterium]
MPNFIVHIGPHKTGTTYLQLTLAAAKDRLAAIGAVYPAIWYASPDNPSHHLLSQRVRQHELDALRREVRDLTALDCDTVIISAEDLKDLDNEEVKILADTLPSGRVTIVYYCRRWSELLPSAWQETIRQGQDHTLPEFLARRTVNLSTSMLVNYGNVLDKYIAAFGVRNVRLASYNNIVDSGWDLAEHFLTTFVAQGDVAQEDVAHGDRRPWPEVRARPNASMAPAEIEIIRMLNQIHHERGGGPGGALRNWYHLNAGRLDVSELSAAMNENMATIEFSDSSVRMEAFHQRLFKRYRTLMVPPASGDRLFTPHRRDLAYVLRDYLCDPAMMRRLDEIYRCFLAL